ncbi:DUF1667 domain-containing protein [Oscillibacter sp.]|uniref:DUF1667 domain-containing protein n=1 Tax=Oscillibacter sp. TaxID=1945593 RepID=UPI002D7E4728|nr:DUF1667 domain-containing protein [Oscillibacter sp.]
MKQIVCTVCPRGCEMEAQEVNGVIQVKNNGCARGETYARTEYVRPVRLFTSFLRVKGGTEPLVPVRSTSPIPREQHFDCVAALRKITLQAPVERYHMILPDVFGSGADIVTSGQVEQETV